MTKSRGKDIQKVILEIIAATVAASPCTVMQSAVGWKRRLVIHTKLKIN